MSTPVLSEVFEGLVVRPHEHARPAAIADEMGYAESARWVREHARGIFQGFVVTVNPG